MSAPHSHDGHDHTGHSHGDHAHTGHAHAPTSFGKAFAVGTGLNLAFVLVEATFGVRAHSMALLADAGHNLSDVLGLVLAWGTAVLATRRPTARHTYGFRSSTILAALANAVLLLVAIGAIGWEAVRRFAHPEPVVAGTMVGVAVVGIVINTATALLFMSGRKHDLNVRGAFLHMAADAGVSLGVVLAGLAIGATGWLWLDPVISLAIVVVIAVGTWGLLRDSTNLALAAVPAPIDRDEVEVYLRALPGVTEVHDVHIWGMSTTDTALTAHLIRPVVADDDALLLDVSRVLRERFGIAHPTVQIERGHGPHPCALAPDHVV